MIFLNSRFNFGDKTEKAKVIDASDESKIRINGTEFFERVKLTEKDLEGLNYEKTSKYDWQNSEILGSGKYKVTYNQVDYFITYLDELDLFKSVVVKSTIQERKNAVLEIFQVLGLSPTFLCVAQ